MPDKQEWINNMVSDLMYDDEFLEYTDALEIATIMWLVLETEYYMDGTDE